ncbi:hypothetical protein TcWFU_005660 [Taenia crassiceps]|uniref:NTF2 domain-containing protein n=1 Tax=Taenia crassiceps TaxID=6207 RepID=A0ABR4QB05_9CEST
MISRKHAPDQIVKCGTEIEDEQWEVAKNRGSFSRNDYSTTKSQSAPHYRVVNISNPLWSIALLLVFCVRVMVSNGDVCAEGPSLPKMDFTALSNLAEQFVLQYYAVMNKCPELLHRFYDHVATEAKERTKPVSEKPPTKASNGAAQEQKRQVHEKRSEAHQAVNQESEPRGMETPVPPRTPTPKPPAETSTQKVVEKQSAAPVVQCQPAPSPPPPSQQPLPVAEPQHQQPVVQQPISTAPMSWAQRASGNIGSTPTSVVTHRAQTQPAKRTPAEHPVVNAQTGSGQKVGLPKQTRGGGRSQQIDTRRDSNGDRGDAQSSQQQQFPHQQQSRGGFVQSGGARESMRNNGGGAGRGNRGTGSARGGGGGNRGAGNPVPRR